MVSTVKESVFLKCLRKEPTSHTPVWLMRQAGRYQPEYRDIRERVGFLQLCKTPELAAEVTVLAVEQLGVDAGIIFADILLPLEPMGVGLRFEKGDGPVIDKPIRSLKDVDAISDFDPQDDLSYVSESIKVAVRELSGKVPLIGFAGAPFTLASYAVEGGSSRSFERTKTLMYSEPETFHELMRKLTAITIQYLQMQIEAGASAVQLFDSWAGALSPNDYGRFVLPYTQEVVYGVKDRAPVIYFATMSAGLLHLMSITDADMIGVDWRIDLDYAWSVIGYEMGIQGNLDPMVLLSDKKRIEEQTRNILDKAEGRPGHVFNLGHGVLKDTPPENVKYLVDLVHELSSGR